MGGDGTRRVPLMATSELNDSLKRDVLCRSKTLQNLDQKYPEIVSPLDLFSHPVTLDRSIWVWGRDCVRLEQILSPEDPKVVRFADFVNSC